MTVEKEQQKRSVDEEDVWQLRKGRSGEESRKRSENTGKKRTAEEEQMQTKNKTGYREQRKAERRAEAEEIGEDREKKGVQMQRKSEDKWKKERQNEEQTQKENV